MSRSATDAGAATDCLPHADLDSGPYWVYFKDGTRQQILGIDGGGMMIGVDPDAAYEVHAEDLNGDSITLLQASIAAMVNVRTQEQHEFGNPLLATHSGHPRGTR